MKYVTLLLVAVVVAYSGVFANHFLFDDEFLIQKNQVIRSVSTLPEIFTQSSTQGSGGHDDFYRPLQTVCYWIVYHISGLSPAGFHTLNLILHFTAGIAVFYLGLSLGLAELWSFLAALLWLLHPVHTEAVTYMSATADPLYALFCLLSVLALIRLSGPKRWIWSMTAALCALLSKESAAVIPLLVMTVLGTRELTAKRSLLIALKKVFMESLPFWCLVGAYLLARKTFLNFDHSFQFYPQANIYTEHMSFRFFTFLATLPSYLGVLIWPFGLHMERSFPVFTQITFAPVLEGLALFLLLLTSLAWGVWKSRPWAFFIPAWILAAHVTQSGVFLPVNSFFLEHWLYLPSISLFLGIGLGLEHINRHYAKIRPVLVTGAIVVATLLGIRTFAHNKTWSDPITFYTHILKFEKGTARVHNNLGMAYSDQGRIDQAIAQYKDAISISDAYPNTHHNLALAYLSENDTAKAISELKRAVAMDPAFYHSYYYLARIYQRLGDQEQAALYTKKFEETRPQP